jgi:hypothetical protein
MKPKRTELSVRLDAGGVCIQGEHWNDMNVARIRFPKGAVATLPLEGLPGDGPSHRPPRDEARVTQRVDRRPATE